LEAIMDITDSEICHIFEEMQESCLSLDTWEFKSIIMGSDDVMRAVGNLGKFSWTNCSDMLCSTLTKHQEHMKNVRRTVVGCDMQNPPWKLNICSFGPKLADHCWLFYRMILQTPSLMLMIQLMWHCWDLLLTHLLNHFHGGPLEW
jgi:hypothetical protein